MTAEEPLDPFDPSGPAEAEHPQDRDLAALLRAHDPAADLPPLTPAHRARLRATVQEVDMTRSRRTPLLAAAAAVAVIAVGGGLVLAGGSDDTAPDRAAAESASTSGDDAGEAAAAPTVTDLTDAGGVSAKCLPPESNPQVVAAQEVVVDAVATEVSDDTVTLTPSRWFAGAPTDLVVIAAPPAAGRMSEMSVEFVPGERYLVSATGGAVTACGFTAPWSADLEAVYEAAFS